MAFKAKEMGHEITAIFGGVELEKINNFDLIKNTSIDLLKKTGFHILSVSEHIFSPQGFTFMVLLSESHFAVHTYPEYNTIYFHLYTCGDKNDEVIFSKLKDIFSPIKIVIRKEDVRVKF